MATAAARVWGIAELREQIIELVVILDKEADRDRGFIQLVRGSKSGPRPIRSSCNLILVSHQTADEVQYFLWRYLQYRARMLIFNVPDLDFTEMLNFFEDMPPKLWQAVKARNTRSEPHGQVACGFTVQLEFTDYLPKSVGREDEMAAKLIPLDRWLDFQNRHGLRECSAHAFNGRRPARWDEMRLMKAFDFEAPDPGANQEEETGAYRKLAQKDCLKHELDLHGEENDEEYPLY